jgi:hypothetical protein
MPGELHQLSSQLWMIEGGFVAGYPGLPEAANAFLYQVEDSLYLLDSGMGEGMRAAIEEKLMAIGAPGSFTLLNTDRGIGGNGNNDIIHNVLTDEKSHLALRIPGNEAQALAEHLYALSCYVDPFRAVDGNGLRQFGLRCVREALAAFFGQRTALRWMLAMSARRWPLVNSSPETATVLMLEDAETLELGGVTWQGWRLGMDVWALQVGSGLWCYLPVEKTLFAPGWRDAFSPVWPEAQDEDQLVLLDKLMTMTRAGVVSNLIDGSHTDAIREQEEILQTAEQMRSRRQGLQQALEAILHREPGMTVRNLYRRLRKLRHRPAVAWYIDAPLPAGLMCFEQFLVSLLLEMGCTTRGIWRHKKFYLPEERMENRL